MQHLICTMTKRCAVKKNGNVLMANAFPQSIFAMDHLKMVSLLLILTVMIGPMKI